MPRFRFGTRVIVGATLVLLAWGTWATVKPAAQSRDAEAVQALRELVVEVRGLRTIVER